MSNIDYDVVLNITYDYEHRHYVPRYRIAIPYWSWKWQDLYPQGQYATYDVYLSFDDGDEIPFIYSWKGARGEYPPDPYYISVYTKKEGNITGVYEKAYFRNPRRNDVTFTPENCFIVDAYYSSPKESFNIQWNSVGFVANHNASFKCSTIWRNTPQQYEWVSATVYYKKSTDVAYQSANATLSGTWSDVLVSTNVDLEDGYTYDVYITAISDDGSSATTSVEQFSTIDATAIASCIAPSGTFTAGDVTFIWSHRTDYGTPQYAYDLQYSNNNGSSWTTVANHVVTTNTTTTTTLTDAGSYIWRVRTYNTNNVAGEWAQASFVNQVPANPPTNLQITTAGRPTVSWTSISQTAYQVQFIASNSVVYDSGAVYTSETSHFVNQYFNDTQSYVVKVRIYNGLGEVSDWAESGYQQPAVTDVDFTIEQNDGGGATITIIPDEVHVKYYVLRNDKLIAEVDGETYTDIYAVGLTNYSVVGVTSSDQSDIQTKGFKVAYPHATIIAQNGQQFLVNKRVDTAYDISTNNQADINKANFLGDSYPTHYPSAMRLKSFNISCFDDQGIAEGLLGTLVFYADNFANGGWCMVTAYDKTDNFIKNGQGIYANEVILTLEVTNYDDSIEYPI